MHLAAASKLLHSQYMPIVSLSSERVIHFLAVINDTGTMTVLYTPAKHHCEKNVTVHSQHGMLKQIICRIKTSEVANT
jgi:hypothetical protein